MGLNHIEKFLTRVDAKLSVDVGKVGLGRSLSDMELFLDEGQAAALRQKQCDFALPCGEAVRAQPEPSPLGAG